MSKFHSAVMVGESTIRFLYEGAPSLELEASYDLVEGRLVVQSLTVRAVPLGRMLAAHFRRIPLVQAERWGRQEIARLRGAPVEDTAIWGPTRLVRTGRRGRDDLYYAQIAEQYVQIYDKTLSQPIKVLSEALCLSRSSVNHLIFTARQRGLLSPASPGKAGGYLTDKAKATLYGDTDITN